MPPTTTDRIQSTSLYFRDGPSDKEYHAAIEPKADGFIVTFAYGRRGNTLTHRIAADVDTERDLLPADLTKASALLTTHWIGGFHKIMQGRNGGGDSWHTDGRLPVATLSELPQQVVLLSTGSNTGSSASTDYRDASGRITGSTVKVGSSATGHPWQF